jgi:hypothetical protein
MPYPCKYKGRKGHVNNVCSFFGFQLFLHNFLKGKCDCCNNNARQVAFEIYL